MVLVSRRPGDDNWRFRESCPAVLRAGSNPSHAWSEERTACTERMLLWCADVVEDLWGLVGVAASIKKGPGKSPGPGASRSQKGACSVASGASSEACELEVVASGSGSPRSSLRTASARMDHEVIFEVFAFLPLPFGRS